MKIVDKFFINNHIPFYISPVNKYLGAELIYSLVQIQFRNNSSGFAIA